jgi:hypothetical protein
MYHNFLPVYTWLSNQVNEGNVRTVTTPNNLHTAQSLCKGQSNSHPHTLLGKREDNLYDAISKVTKATRYQLDLMAANLKILIRRFSDIENIVIFVVVQPPDSLPRPFVRI